MAISPCLPDPRHPSASLYDFLRSESAEAAEPSFREWSCPPTAPQLPHDVARKQGNVRNDPDLVLTYMGGLFVGACSGEPPAARSGRPAPRQAQTFDAPDLLFLAAKGDKAIGRLTLPARMS
jgi:hypothetical protein